MEEGHPERNKKRKVSEVEAGDSQYPNVRFKDDQPCEQK